MPNTDHQQPGSYKAEKNSSPAGMQPAATGTPAASSLSHFDTALPVISLPKGGGAIKGIEEKFRVNAVTGTSSLSIPLPFSAGRTGAPAIGLSYNSGAGNSAFGLGWQLDIPSVARKTEKRLPQYFDEEESDTFIIAGAEDLVPLLELQSGKWVPYKKQRTVNGISYTIRRYRPRIEGSFTRIEKWTKDTTGEVHWKTISAGNVHSYFGVTAASRLADPADPQRVFEWLLSYTHDDKGNITLFQYKPEDYAGIPSVQYEKNKTGHCSQLYLKKILYCNKTPWNLGDALPAENDFLFSTLFDYGEHAAAANLPQTVFAESRPWPCRKDPFSTHRSGFEIRTWRRCKRVLMFHCFSPQELPVNPYLTKSLELFYDDELNYTGSGRKESGFSFLVMVRQSGHIWDAAQNFYTTKSLPETEFSYQPHEWNTEVSYVTAEQAVQVPAGLQDKRYLWIDLFNEGIAGILTEQGGSWYYKSNLGGAEFSNALPLKDLPSFRGLATGMV
ncbi:MAG TPA: SpvB/TcaC N-terminal domain-containing protein, partial [Chitinophagaceae bacterium]|nr:SpvB/TcaC N-terminal domain-containing protein [Chitinophagaceae bacterium]